MSLPAPIPFWELERGDGPVTRWVKSREYLDARQKERLARIMEPHKHVTASTLTDGLSVRERKSRGLCVVDMCGRQTHAGRCEWHMEELRAQTHTRRRRLKSTYAAADATSCDFGGEDESEGVK